MPMEREPIFHDRQSVVVMGPINTTSTTFVDIPGAALTTKDLSQGGTYQIWVSMELVQTNNNSTVDIRSCVDGVPGATRAIHFGPNSSGDPQSITLIGQGSGINDGSVIQIQWHVDVGTATLNDLEMIIDGIPDTRLVT